MPDNLCLGNSAGDMSFPQGAALLIMTQSSMPTGGSGTCTMQFETREDAAFDAKFKFLACNI